MTNARAELGAAVRTALFAKTIRTPVSQAPKEGTVSIVDNGGPEGWGSRAASAKFRKGHWVKTSGKPLPFEPTYWLGLRDD